MTVRMTALLLREIKRSYQEKNYVILLPENESKETNLESETWYYNR